jgi:hypothetical protein
VAEDLDRGAVQDLAPCLHHQDALEKYGLGHRVGDVQDAHARAAVQVPDGGDQTQRGGNRQERGRLVQDQEPGLHGKRPRYGDPLLLPGREVLDELALYLF